jgi:hypothetical protein
MGQYEEPVSSIEVDQAERRMDEAAGVDKKGLVLAFALIAYVGAVGALASFLVPEVSTAAPQATSSPAVAAFSFPLLCDATVVQSLPSGREPIWRCYVAKSTKEAQ